MVHYCSKLFLQTPDKYPTDAKILLFTRIRKRKSRIANMITSNIKKCHLTQENHVEVLCLIENLRIFDKSTFWRKPTRSGRKLTDLMTWQEVCKFWHDQSIPSTNTQKIPKLRVIDQPRIKSNLEYVSTVITFKQRNKAYSKNCRKNTHRVLCRIYSRKTCEMGTFLALIAFLVRQISTKDIQRCCCKLYLHARWSIDTLLECCKLKSINLSNLGKRLLQPFCVSIRKLWKEIHHTFVMGTPFQQEDKLQPFTAKVDWTSQGIERVLQ